MTEGNENTPDWWDDLSEHQKAYIEEGLEDARNGKTMSSEEFWKHLKSKPTD